MNDRIEFIQTRNSYRTVQLANRWEFTPHGRLTKLVRWILRLAVKHGHIKPAFDRVCDVTRHVVHPSSVIEAIARQKPEVFDQIGRHATTVAMGSDDYSELMRESDIHQYLSFPAKVRDERGVLGLTVKVVPWMRGVVVLP